jgi:hypothetical protein
MRQEETGKRKITLILKSIWRGNEWCTKGSIALYLKTYNMNVQRGEVMHAALEST